MAKVLRLHEYIESQCLPRPHRILVKTIGEIHLVNLKQSILLAAKRNTGILLIIRGLSSPDFLE